jgi:hypothetical protein
VCLFCFFEVTFGVDDMAEGNMKLNMDVCPYANKLFAATGPAGSAVLFDMRARHHGMANKSPKKRSVPDSPLSLSLSLSLWS